MLKKSNPFVVDIWSDFVCPWCWIAKRRFEKALESFRYKELVQVNARAYRLAPNYVAEPIKKTLVKKFGNLASAEAMMSTVTQHANVEGLVYRFDTMLFGDTADAHMLVKAMEGEPVQSALIEALYEQSITHGKSLFDRASLELIAERVGVTSEAVQRVWKTSGLRTLMQKDERAAAEMGSGVPLFVFNDGFRISGAQSVESFKEALDRMFAQSNTNLDSMEGQTCGLDGCKI